MPSLLRHPGAELYRNPRRRNRTLLLRQGREREAGRVGAERRETVHTLVIGPAGGGKTTVLRSLVTGAVCHGIPGSTPAIPSAWSCAVRGCPSVGGIASSPEQIAA
ncbi:hypothetical protein QJS66_23560 (plasmid) [Kocuria rhizophila]|nr:hypothetical protein QJS66_23560 [Kocuria rhizophila]